MSEIDPSEIEIRKFNVELMELLKKYNITTYAFACICFRPEGIAYTPSALRAVARPDQGLGSSRVAAILAGQLCGLVLDAMRKYCGLDINAAVGAGKGMMETEGHEMSMELLEARSSNSSYAEA